MENFLDSTDIKRFGLKLDGDFEVNAGTIPSISYEPKLVFGNVVRVGDSANFATPTVGEGIRICMERGTELGIALGHALQTKTAAPLKQYEANCKKKLQRNYYFGFLANQRFSQYKASDWDKSIRRISYLNESELVALLRSEFTGKMVIKTIIKLIRQKISGAGGGT